MRNMKFIVNAVLAVSSIAALAQESARTVQYHSQDIVAIRAKVKYTTLIEVATRPKRSWKPPRATRISGLSMWSATFALCIRRNKASAPT